MRSEYPGLLRRWRLLTSLTTDPQGWKRQCSFDELVKEMVEADVEGVRPRASLPFLIPLTLPCTAAGQARQPRLELFDNPFPTCFSWLVSAVPCIPLPSHLQTHSLAGFLSLN